MFNAEGTVVYNAIYHLSITLSVLEILALKFENCSKLRQILDVFLPSQILKGRCPQKLYMGEHPHLAAHHVAKFRGAIPLSSKVMVAHMLHFKPILTPRLQRIVKGTLVSGGVLASKTWTFYNTCENFRAQHPLWAEIWYSKKVNFLATIAPLNRRG